MGLYYHRGIETCESVETRSFRRKIGKILQASRIVNQHPLRKKSGSGGQQLTRPIAKGETLDESNLVQIDMIGDWAMGKALAVHYGETAKI